MAFIFEGGSGPWIGNFGLAGGGAFFSTGSIAWAGAMAWNNYDNEVARMTHNVLRRFNEETPFDFPGGQGW